MKSILLCGLAAVVMHGHAFEYGRKDASGGTDDPDIKTLAANLKLATDEVKRFAEEANKKMTAGEQMSAESKQKADEALVKLNEIGARMTEAEQKLARRGNEDDDSSRQKSTGEQVTGTEEVKALLSSKRGRARVSVKAIISALTTVANGSAGDLIVPQRIPGIVAPPNRRMTVRNLLMPGRTSSNALQYVKETGFTNSAATVSETSGASKPQSELQFDLVNAAVTTIAHFVKATIQILDDVPMLESYIDGRLRYGLEFVEEAQLLMGGGTGTDLNGLYTQATAFSAPFTPTDQTMIDTIRLALLQAALAEYPASGIVLSMHDWARIEMTKDGEGRYILGGPGSGAQPLLWRLPVVETQAMTVDKFLVGAFNMAAQIFDREDAHVDISTEDADNFTKNLVTIRAEERLALAVYRPEAFIKGDLGQVP